MTVKRRTVLGERLAKSEAIKLAEWWNAFGRSGRVARIKPTERATLARHAGQYDVVYL